MRTWNYLRTISAKLIIPNFSPCSVLKLFQKSDSKKHFRYKLFCVFENDLEPSDTLSLVATLKIHDHEKNKDKIIHGTITKIIYSGYKPDGNHYELEIQPVLCFLKYFQTNRIWVNKSINQILTDILSSHFYLKINHTIKLDYTFNLIDYLIQYNESDYLFLKRFLSNYQLNYYYIHDNERCVLYITHDSSLSLNLLGDRVGVRGSKNSTHPNQCATIESIYNNQMQAYRNMQGYYYIRHPFDQSNKPKGCASKAIPYMQYHSGLQFALYPETTVMLGYLNNNMNEPFILGVLANNKHPNPVNRNN
ncbi:MAG: contractile injection system protein, VgrG/Pvc8 family, partial [Gammaproteobacteria bacterium]